MATPPTTSPTCTSLNLDILDLVVSYHAIDLGGSGDACRTSRRTLLNLALSSRHLTESALRMLWRSMDSLSPLLRLISAFQRTGNQYEMSGLFSQHPSSWKRWDYYASKIKEFKYLPPGPVTIHSATYSWISRMRGTLHILPNLQSLYIDLRNASSLQDFDCVLNSVLAEPTLRRLEIWNPDNTQLNLGLSLSTLRLCCKAIRTVHLYGPISPDILKVSSSFVELRELHYFPASGGYTGNQSVYESFLRNLATVPNLQGVTLDLGYGDYSGLEPLRHPLLSFGPQSFSSLKRMTMRGDISSIVQIMSFTKATALQELDLEMHCQHCRGTDKSAAFHWQSVNTLRNEEGIKLLIRQISKEWAGSLRSLKICVSCCYLARSNDTSSFLIPIAEIDNLRSLEVTVTMKPANPRLTVTPQNALPDMETAIHRLTRLTQLQHLYLPLDYAASLDDVYYLACHLPNLRALRVSITLSDIPPTRTFPPLIHSLCTLDVGYSDPFPVSTDLQSAQIICWHLHRMFPRLTTIFCDSSPTWSQAAGVLSFTRSIEAEILEDERESQRIRLAIRG